jgi:hypothetical protein
MLLVWCRLHSETARARLLPTLRLVRAASYGTCLEAVGVSPAQKLLDRLERVKQTGPGRWIAACPAHQDRSPSLSIRETSDGLVLLHDFGGCPTSDVLGAIGLCLSDLFENPLVPVRSSHSRIPACDILLLLDHETLVVVLILDDVVSRRK